MQTQIRKTDNYQPFSNLQLELIKLFADNVQESDLLAIKRLIAQHFANKASDLADIAWEQRNLDAKSLLKKNMRTNYKRQSK
jgi:hypothetical protein